MLRHRRPDLQPRRGVSRPARSPGSTSRRDARARAGQGRGARAPRPARAARVRRRRPARAARSPTTAFAAVTVGWGVRNVPDVPRAFREMARVTRPGGRVVCLESTQAPDGAGQALPRRLDGPRRAAARARRHRRPARRTPTCRPPWRAFPRAGELAAIMAAAGLVGRPLPAPRLRRRRAARRRGAAPRPRCGRARARRVPALVVALDRAEAPRRAAAWTSSRSA